MQEVFEKIIKKVKENAYMVVQKNNSKELGMTLCGFEQVINEVSAEYNNGWIPCSVRIPTEQERWFGHDLTDAEPREFIVMVKGAYEPTTGYYHSGYGCWVKDLTSEYDDKNTGYGNEIVAWRFFPQPYQPKGE